MALAALERLGLLLPAHPCPPGARLKTSRHLLSALFVLSIRSRQLSGGLVLGGGCIEDKGLAPLTAMGGGEEMSARHVQHQETHKTFSGCEMFCAGESSLSWVRLASN